MNKTELSERIAIELDLSNAQAQRSVQAIISAIFDELGRGGEIRFPGFGAFSVRERAARTGRDPRSGKSIEISARKVIHFAPSKTLKEAIND